MIQEANIGVGIYGKEGTQAARASDYSLQMFKHLRRLVTVHGRYSLIRNAGVIQTSLYKNMAFFFVQFWYAFFCAYSGQTVYDDWIVTFYNTILTSSTPFFIAVFDKDISERIIYENPSVFKAMSTGYVFTYTSVFTWLLSAFYHSLVFFFFGFAMFSGGDVLTTDGTIGGVWFMGGYVGTAAILVVLHKIALETNSWTWVNHFFHWLSIVAYFITLIYVSFDAVNWPQGYGTIQHLIVTPTWYLFIFLVFWACLLPDIIVKYVKRQYFPEDWQILQERYRKNLVSNMEIMELPEMVNGSEKKGSRQITHKRYLLFCSRVQ